jgi:DNA-directed RNA polymerase subunit RPC12/RpoP
MAKLHCPHCNQPVAASPLGRWYSRFQCPHCRGKLQFDARTNAIGMAGSAFFFIMVWAIIMGRSPIATTLAWAAAAVWIASLALSYALRRVVKD